MFFVPDNLARTTVELHGEAGVRWLDQLPALVARCARRWSLTVQAPFAPLSYNYVAPVVRADGIRAVLKLGVCGPQIMAEIEALRLINGAGGVRLLEVDPDQGALLLERLCPGTPLAALVANAEDEKATEIAAAVMRQLWRPVPPRHPFPSVADWAAGLAKLRKRFGGTTGPFPAALVEEAETLFAQLIASMDEAVVLHGDLHHDNILAAERAPWLAIDPKGLVGEPAYEVGALLRNPLPQVLALSEPGRLLARRVDQLAEQLEIDRARLRGWGMAQAVLAAWWTLEDHDRGWEPWIACAALLAAVKA